MENNRQKRRYRLYMLLFAEIMTVVVSGVILSTPLFAKDSKENVFWKWFKKNQEELYHFEKNQKFIFDQLAKAMNKVHPDLTFEFSPVLVDGTREFVISAGGTKSAFPAVEALYAAAPKLSKWKIVKYRPRRSPINDIEFAGRKVKAKDVHYAIFEDDAPKKIGIMIFLDGYTEEDKRSVWGQIGYLFLDEALGEYNVEMHVGAIVFQNRDSKYFQHARPLSELPVHFDEQLKKRNETANQ